MRGEEEVKRSETIKREKRGGGGKCEEGVQGTRERKKRNYRSQRKKEKQSNTRKREDK